jgi:hypothetical protein
VLDVGDGAPTGIASIRKAEISATTNARSGLS